MPAPATIALLTVAGACALWICREDYRHRRIPRWHARLIGLLGIIGCLFPPAFTTGAHPLPRALVMGAALGLSAAAVNRKAPHHLGFGDVRLAFYLGPWIALGQSVQIWFVGLCIMVLFAVGHHLICVRNGQGSQRGIAGGPPLVGASALNLALALLG